MRRTPFLALLTLLAAGCGSDPALETGIVHNPDVPPGNENAFDNIHVEVVATYGGEAENLDAVLGGWMETAVSPDEQIVALDFQSSQLKSYDSDGNHLWTALGPGEGPGEISNGGQLHFGPDGNVYFANQGTARLDVVSADGEFKESLDYANMGLDRPGFQGFLNDSLAVFYKSRRGVYGGTITTVNMRSDWSVADSFFVEFKKEEPADPRVITWLEIATIDGRIVIPNQFAFEQRVYSATGELLTTMVRDKDGLTGLKLVEMENGYAQVQYSRQQAPWVLDSDWLIVHSRWTINWEEMIAGMGKPRDENSPQAEIRESLDFYTRDWKLVWSLDADQMDEMFNGYVHYTDGNGHLYTYDTEMGMGYKYRVRVER